MKRPDLIAVNIADFSSAAGVQAFNEFWAAHKNDEKYTADGSIFSKQLKMKVNMQKHLAAEQKQTEEQIWKALVLVDFFRANQAFKPQPQVIVKPKKEPQERKLYEENLKKTEAQLKGLLSFAKISSESATLSTPEQAMANGVKQNIISHYSKYNFNDRNIITAIHQQIIDYIVESIAKDYLNNNKGAKVLPSLAELKILILNEAKYRNDKAIDSKADIIKKKLNKLYTKLEKARQDFYFQRITEQEYAKRQDNYTGFRSACKTSDFDIYDKNKAALRLLHKAPEGVQRGFQDYLDGPENRCLAIDSYDTPTSKFSDKVDLLQYMCMQWVAASDPLMKLDKVVILTRKEQEVTTINNNFNAGKITEDEKTEQLNYLESLSKKEYALKILPECVEYSKQAFVTVLGDICREHSLDIGYPKLDVSSCKAGVNGRLARINNYNTIAKMKDPGSMLHDIARMFIYKKYNSLPNKQKIQIGEATDEILTGTGSFFQDEENSVLAEDLKKAVNSFLDTLNSDKTKEEFNALIGDNLRGLVKTNLIVPEETYLDDTVKNQKVQQCIDLSYDLILKRIILGHGPLSEEFVDNSTVSQILGAGCALLKRQDICRKFVACRTEEELTELSKEIDGHLKTVEIHGKPIKAKLVNKLRAYVLPECTSNYGIIPFSKICHNGVTYNEIKIPGDGNCLLTTVINGCAQHEVRLPEGIYTIGDLRACLVRKMRDVYSDAMTYLAINYMINFQDNWEQTNPRFLEDMHQHRHDCRFVAQKDIVGKFTAAILDHNEYYPNNQVHTIEEYFGRLAGNGIWCGGLELQFLSDLLNIKITVNSAINSQLTHLGGHLVGAAGKLDVYHTGSHYELLWPESRKRNYDPSKIISRTQCSISVDGPYAYGDYMGNPKMFRAADVDTLVGIIPGAKLKLPHSGEATVISVDMENCTITLNKNILQQDAEGGKIQLLCIVVINSSDPRVLERIVNKVDCTDQERIAVLGKATANLRTINKIVENSSNVEVLEQAINSPNCSDYARRVILSKAAVSSNAINKIASDSDNVSVLEIAASHANCDDRARSIIVDKATANFRTLNKIASDSNDVRILEQVVNHVNCSDGARNVIAGKATANLRTINKIVENTNNVAVLEKVINNPNCSDYARRIILSKAAVSSNAINTIARDSDNVSVLEIAASHANCDDRARSIIVDKATANFRTLNKIANDSNDVRILRRVVNHANCSDYAKRVILNKAEVNAREVINVRGFRPTM